MSDALARVHRRLPAHPSSAGEARRMVGRLLAEADRDDLVEAAQLLVSEVVTNALVHSGTPIDVSMAVADDGILVEVGDGSEHLPFVRNYAVTASTGRGLALLDRTADAWGIVRSVRGKTVWFQLSSADDAEPAAPPVPEQADRLAPVVPLQPDRSRAEVQLLNVPLLLHSAWQQHAEAVLREYLLASMDYGDGPMDDDPLVVHAAAIDALAVLEEQIPQPDTGADPCAVMSAAVDPHLTRSRIEVWVPAESVPHFGTLDAALEQARTMAEERRLLVPSVQPELQALRRWLCRQVQEQSHGGKPVPWPPGDVMVAPPVGRAMAWDPTAVTESAHLVLAADDTDLIVATSKSACALLGYDHDELLGQRLVTIIPHRYRQAHVAGFTLHLLTGRGPLLDQSVVVPALCKDGSETMVELGIRSKTIDPGRTVFIATLCSLADS